MKNRKKLYDHAKQCNTEESWYAYNYYHKVRIIKYEQNGSNQLMNGTVVESWTRTTFSGHQHQFWKYIKAMKKSTSIPSLTMDNRTVINAKDKATALNGQFQCRRPD